MYSANMNFFFRVTFIELDMSGIWLLEIAAQQIARSFDIQIACKQHISEYINWYIFIGLSDYAKAGACV